MCRSAVLVVLAIVAACGGRDTTARLSTKETVVMPRVDLLPPDTRSGRTLTDTLAHRRSVRDYERTPLSMPELSQLLWAAQGITSGPGERTAPSAGGTYPLELYVLTGKGRYRYHPDDHQLELLGEDDVRTDLAAAAVSQEWVARAPAIFLIAAVSDRTEQRYGDRAERYVKLEAGHAAQNLLLQAVALNLGAVPVGAFDDDRITKVAGLAVDHEALYLIPVGHPVR